jgi:hypothetical protein
MKDNKDNYRRWENRVAAERKTARENLDRELAEINLKVTSSFGESSYDELDDEALRASILAKKRFAVTEYGVTEIEDEEEKD